MHKGSPTERIFRGQFLHHGCCIYYSKIHSLTERPRLVHGGRIWKTQQIQSLWHRQEPSWIAPQIHLNLDEQDTLLWTGLHVLNANGFYLFMTYFETKLRTVLGKNAVYILRSRLVTSERCWLAVCFRIYVRKCLLCVKFEKKTSFDNFD